ncbi:MAG: 2,3,4,5-tetrahydropyridine-2,6-carboxylate N-succinyltransferase, partial [Campylobacteraceae bacterium]|nr:2,3,4,5-tetrahydropyridine-2,6-carboxylate N-succinyltransferase [Campylobacteraceae bacterium]
AVIFVAALSKCNISVDFSKSEFVCDVKKKFVKNALMAFEPFLSKAEGDAHKNIQVLNHLNFIAQNEGLEKDFRLVFIFEDKKPLSVEAVYLKLYALSTGKAPLHSLNLENAFDVLENVAWSMNVPIELAWLRENEIELKLDGTFPVIDSVDKFPRFLQHVIPADNMRILDASKVCMGARLADEIIVKPGANYIDFDAGTSESAIVDKK